MDPSMTKATGSSEEEEEEDGEDKEMEEDGDTTLDEAIDEISSKSSEGQKAKFTASLAAIAEAWEEADSLGLLADKAGEAAQAEAARRRGAKAGRCICAAYALRTLYAGHTAV